MRVRPMSARWLAGVSMLFLLPAPLRAQAGPQVFGHVGLFLGGGDEGSIGNGASYGGGVTLPLSRRFVGEFDVQTSKVARIRSADDFYKTRRTLRLTSLFYRWGAPTAYGFVGAGIGTQFVDSVTRENNFAANYTPVGWQEIRPRVFEMAQSETRSIHFSPRIGFAGFPTSRLGVRVDFYVASWHLGARVGVGYRFK